MGLLEQCHMVSGDGFPLNSLWNWDKSTVKIEETISTSFLNNCINKKILLKESEENI